MSEYCETEHIAASLQLPQTVVEKYLAGEITDEFMANYDPANPPDIRVHKDKSIKTIEDKLEKIEKSTYTSFLSKLWNFTAQAVWLIAVICGICVSIYTGYYVGQESGFENELLTKFALGLEGVISKILS